MKRVFAACASRSPALACAALARRAVVAPEIAYDANADLLKLPDNIHLGEAAGVATNSKGHIFVYTRTGAAHATLGTLADVLQGGSRLFEFDQTGKFVREIGAGRLRLQLRAGGAHRSAGQHLGRRSGIEQGDQVRSRRPHPARAEPQAGSDRGAPGGGAAAPDAAARRRARGGAAAEGRGRRPAAARGAPRGRARLAAAGGGRGPAGPPGAGIPGDSFERTADVAWDAAGNIYVADGAAMASATRASRSSTRTATSSSRGDSAAASRGSSTRCAASRSTRRATSTSPTRGNKRIQVFDGDGNAEDADREHRHADGDLHHAGRASVPLQLELERRRDRSTTARSTSWSSTARSSASSAAPAGCRRSSAW